MAAHDDEQGSTSSGEGRAAVPAGMGTGSRILVAVETIVVAALLIGFIFYRQTHRDVVDWGQQLLDPVLGAVIVVAVLAATLASLGATQALVRGRRSIAVVALLITALLGAATLACIGVDYNAKWRHRLLPGSGYSPTRTYLASVLHRPIAAEQTVTSPVAAATPAAAAAEDAQVPDAARGKALFMQTCATCHGANAQGLPNQGAPLRTSKFVASQSDDQLLAFIKKGRQPGDPQSVLGLTMPPRGGNPSLNDAKLHDIIAYLRGVQKEAASQSQAPQAASGPAQAGTGAAPPAEPAIVKPQSLISEPAAPPSGLNYPNPQHPSQLDAVTPPPRAADFFTLHFAAITLEALLVVIGLAAVVALLWGGLRRRPETALHSLSLLAGSQWIVALGAWLGVYILFYMLGT